MVWLVWLRLVWGVLKDLFHRFVSRVLRDCGGGAGGRAELVRQDLPVDGHRSIPRLVGEEELGGSVVMYDG